MYFWWLQNLIKYDKRPVTHISIHFRNGNNLKMWPTGSVTVCNRGAVWMIVWFISMIGLVWMNAFKVDDFTQRTHLSENLAILWPKPHWCLLQCYVNDVKGIARNDPSVNERDVIMNSDNNVGGVQSIWLYLMIALRLRRYHTISMQSIHAVQLHCRRWASKCIELGICDSELISKIIKWVLIVEPSILNLIN